MTVGPVDLVVRVLGEAGYERLEQPQPIGGIPFAFDAMLAGLDSLDLIVVIDLAVADDDERIRRQIGAVAQALDLVRSRRSLTVILAGPRRGAGLIQAIAGVARVLTVGTPTEEAELHDAVAVLLPLEVVADDTAGAEVWTQARADLLRTQPDGIEPVVSAAAQGTAAVESALSAWLAEPFGTLWDEEDG